MSVERPIFGFKLQNSSTMLPIMWLTGNTGAGKTTLASGTQQYFNERVGNDHPLFRKIVVLDGDEMRATISTDETLTAEDRRRHNLRVARLAKHLQSQGFLVIVAVIAPFTSVRAEISDICDPLWVYIKRGTLNTAERPYEPPVDPSFVIDNDVYDVAQARGVLQTFLERTTEPKHAVAW
jgi:adenylylsulfate kinase